MTNVTDWFNKLFDAWEKHFGKVPENFLEGMDLEGSIEYLEQELKKVGKVPKK